MYYYIKGKVAYSEEGRIVIDNNGVGYDLLVSNNTLTRLVDKQEEVTVYTALKMGANDDTIRLFGFYGIEEKSMFLKLTSISGVGPKTALQILSFIDPQTLAVNIVNSDFKALAKVKGIGKKTAMRIIMELKEKLEEEDFETLDLGEPKVKVDDQLSQDAVLALSSLGMTKAEASKRVKEVRAMASTVEEIITIVLKGIK